MLRPGGEIQFPARGWEARAGRSRLHRPPFPGEMRLMQRIPSAFPFVVAILTSGLSLVCQAVEPAKGSEESRFRALFLERDVDRDGTLSRTELPANVRAVFDRIDLDRDGRITWAEELAFRGGGKTPGRGPSAPKPVADSPGRTFNWKPAQAPAGFKAASVEIWIPQEVSASGEVAGILASADYAAGARIFDDAGWRELAARRGLVCLRHDLTRRVDRWTLAKDATAITAIDEALAHVAGESGVDALRQAGFIFTGLSQGGWQAMSLAREVPDRTVAVIAIHESTAVHEPALGSLERLWSIPQLRLWGDRCFLTPYLRDWAAGPARQGAKWTLCLQPATGHADLGDPEFARRWLEAVLRPDRADTEACSGILELRVEGDYTPWADLPPDTGEKDSPREKSITSRKTTRVESAALPASGQKGNVSWLPDQATAKLWLDLHDALAPR